MASVEKSNSVVASLKGQSKIEMKKKKKKRKRDINEQWIKCFREGPLEKKKR